MGAGLSRLEDELRRLSPSLPGPVVKPWRDWKEAMRVMVVPAVPAVPLAWPMERLRSVGLVAVPECGGAPGCSDR